MATITFRDGRKAPHPESTHPRLKFGNFRNLSASYPAAPAAVDYLSKVSAWPMLGNDDWGDCVWAMIGHSIQAITTYGQGATVTITLEDALKGYSDVTGFDLNAGPPGNNPTDQGTNVQDALNYWRKTGVGGHKILAFAQVDIGNDAEVDAALYLFGHIQLGINFPDSAMDQFNAGKPWDVVKGSSVEGGHAIDFGAFGSNGQPAVVGRAANGNLQIVTWGKVQEMTPAFWAKYVEEAWVGVSQEWIDAAGDAPEGLDTVALGEAFSAMTGEANPFPVQPPTPQPTPTPTPVPPQPVGDADGALASVARGWLTHKHVGSNETMAKALQAWLAAKNLSGRQM